MYISRIPSNLELNLRQLRQITMVMYIEPIQFSKKDWFNVRLDVGSLISSANMYIVYIVPL